MKELSYSLKFKEMSEFGTVFSYDTIGDIFYIIIKGLVSIQAPNAELGTVSDFNWKRREYQELLEWKTKRFDPKVETVKKEQYALKLKAKLKQVMSDK